MAWIAASLMCCGVSKSGSPTLRLIIFLPDFCNSSARAETARVGEGLMRCTRSANVFIMGFYSDGIYLGLFTIKRLSLSLIRELFNLEWAVWGTLFNCNRIFNPQETSRVPLLSSLMAYSKG